MREFAVSFGIGCAIGVVYAGLRVKSPAPPLVALVGLLGMLVGEAGLVWIASLVRKH